MRDALLNLYGEIIETRKELVCKFLRDSTLLVVNDEYARTFEMSKEELVGVKFLTLVPESEHAAIHSHLDGLTQKKPEIIYEHPVYLPNGEQVWLEWYDRAIFDNEGKIEYFISIGRDITSKKMMEFDLKNQQKLQALLMDVAIRMVNIPVHALDAAIYNTLREIGSYAQVDRAYVFLYDFKENLLSNTHEWCNEGTSSQIEKLQKLPIDMFPDWLMRHEKGEIYHIPDVTNLPQNSNTRAALEEQDIKTLISAPLMNGEECLGFVGFDAVKKKKVWSETETRLLNVLAELISNSEIRRRFESEIIEARYEAEASNEAKTQFLANISHEIRTPLNGIIGMVELLQKTRLSEEQRNYLKIIDSSGETLQHIIEDILDLHKIETSEVELNEEAFNLAELLKEVTDLFIGKATDKQINLEIENTPLPNEYFDGARLRIKQVLMNLLSNSIKFTNKGFVKVKASLTQRDSETDRVFIRFEVTDTGIGIAKEDMGRLFKPFSQLDSSSTRKYTGSGLGLLISKSLIDRMQGTIGLDSVPGKGTTVWFSIPLRPSSRAPVNDAVLAGSEKLSALIIGGEGMSTVFLKKQLSAHSYAYDYANSIKEAAELNSKKVEAETPYRLVLIYVSGKISKVLEFVDQLKNDPENFNLRVVLLTDKKTKVSRTLLEEHDISDILIHPIRTFEIERILRSPNEDLNMPRVSRLKESESSTQIDDLITHLYTGNVLVAEDNRVNQMLIDLILGKLGVNYKIVENGEEAAKEIEEKSYDVVFMDCQMPVLDGFKATEKIRGMKDRKKAKTHIVAVTAHVIKGYRERCITAGMNDYISKPYKIKDIIKVFDERLKFQEKKTAQNVSGMIVDVDRIRERFGGSDEFIHSLITRFIEDTENLLVELSEACRNEEQDLARDINHNLKGAAVNIEADHIYELTIKMEKAIDARNKRGAQQTIIELHRALKNLQDWFNKSPVL
ncbi:MAG: response regulator [Balneolia bacterium]|nr:response regulator [Balneolia bacterium]